MPDAIKKDSYGVTNPDWESDTNEDLRSHAYELVGGFAARLVELEGDPERPVGATAHADIVVPCHDVADITRQVVYLGYCAEACQELGLLVRGMGADSHEDSAAAGIIVCDAAGFERAQAEQEAEESTSH